MSEGREMTRLSDAWVPLLDLSGGKVGFVFWSRGCLVWSIGLLAFCLIWIYLLSEWCWW